MTRRDTEDVARIQERLAMAGSGRHSINALAVQLETIRAEGRTIVHCHGVFDLLHVGHIRHLGSARELGDVLIVTVTADRFVSKGPGRPAFSQALRIEALEALQCVDHVALSEFPTAEEAIRLLRPDLYVKGEDYRDEAKDSTGGITRERRAVESVGGRLAFTDGVMASSSQLINEHLSPLPEDAREFMRDFRSKYSVEQILEQLDGARNMRVLVVGEAILDEYRYCDAFAGRSSKAPALALRFKHEERFAGGIVAVANHLAALCGEVVVFAHLGAENSQEDFIRSQLHPRIEPVFHRRAGAPTIVKTRFIESYYMSNLFEVYQIDASMEVPPEADAEICARLAAIVPGFDLVVVVDYGHGFLSATAADVISRRARFLALNAQANAANHGMNRLSKYPRADYVCVTDSEMYLQAVDGKRDLESIVVDTSKQLACSDVIVTLGKLGCLAYRSGEDFVKAPALASKVVDRVGAGDAFLAATAPLVAQRAPMEVVEFIGNLAGGDAVARVGHRQHLDRLRLEKSLKSLMR
jgi:rfaE bifunctional protein nucleotidyltransferase chain/domain